MFFHHVSLTAARLLSAFTFLPRHASRSRSLSLSFAFFRARHSLSPAASKTRVSKLARLVSAYLHPRSPTFSVSFALPVWPVCIYTRTRAHTCTDTLHYHARHIFSLYPLPSFFFFHLSLRHSRSSYRYRVVITSIKLADRRSSSEVAVIAVDLTLADVAPSSSSSPPSSYDAAVASLILK